MKQKVIIMYNDSKLLNLRDISLKDAVLLMELNNNKNIAKYVVGNPTIVTLEEEKLWIENQKNVNNTIRKIIEYDGIPVGTVIFSDIDLTNKVANINIKILPKYQGQGLGKVSVLGACYKAFNELNLYCLTAHILDYNTYSQKLFESIGFNREGILRKRIIKKNKRYNLIVYSLLVEDYLK